MSASHDGADPEVRRLIAMLEDRGPDAPPDALRRAFLDFVRRIESTGSRPARVAKVQDTALPGNDGPIPVRVYVPAQPAGDPDNAFVFLHGGGWVVGDLETGDLVPAFADL